MISFCFEESTSSNKTVLFRFLRDSCSSIASYTNLLVVQMGKTHYPFWLTLGELLMPLHPWKGLIFQCEPYRMTRLMQILQLLVHCELSTHKTFFAELKFFLDPMSPELCQLGEVQWNWANLVTLADVALHSWPTAKLTAEWWDFQMSAPSMLILQFLTETLQVRTGVNTLVRTRSRLERIWAWPCGYHPPSGFLFAVSQLPSKIIILSEPWPIEAEAAPNPIWCHNKPLGICNVALLLFGEEKGEKGAAPLTLQSRCEEGKMRVLIGLQVHGILQTQQKSQLSLLVPSLWITRLHLASLVSGCTIQHSTTLKWLTMVSNLAHPHL